MIVSETSLIQDLGQIPALDAPAEGNAGAASTPQDAVVVRVPPPHLSPDLAALLAAITTEPIKLDLLVQQLNRPTGEILGNLLQLELEGLVIQTPPGSNLYQRCG